MILVLIALGIIWLGAFVALFKRSRKRDDSLEHLARHEKAREAMKRWV